MVSGNVTPTSSKSSTALPQSPAVSPVPTNYKIPRITLDQSATYSDSKDKRSTTSKLWGINRKNFKFSNTSSSKVVPIDCLDNQENEFDKSPIILRSNVKSTISGKKSFEGPRTSNVDLPPTIHLSKANINYNLNSNVDKKDYAEAINGTRNSKLASNGVMKVEEMAMENASLQLSCHKGMI